MAGVYYENPPAALTVSGGTSKVLALPCPNRVRLTSLTVVQRAGDTPVLFRVDVYNAQVGDAPSAGLTDYKWLRTPPAGIACDAAGRMNHLFADYDVFFFNQDVPPYVQAQGANTPSLINSQARQVIYLRITNSGGNSATFDIILGSEAPQAW